MVDHPSLRGKKEREREGGERGEGDRERGRETGRERDRERERERERERVSERERERSKNLHKHLASTHLDSFHLSVSCPMMGYEHVPSQTCHQLNQVIVCVVLKLLASLLY